MKLDKQKYELVRARACMSVRELQQAAAIPRPTLNKAISGYSIRPETAGKIARALDVDVTEIIETGN